MVTNAQLRNVLIGTLTKNSWKKALMKKTAVLARNLSYPKSTKGT